MRAVEAYYIGALVSSACWDHEEEHSEASIQFDDGTWTTIMRIGPTRGDWTKTRWKLLAKIVETETGLALTEVQAKELLATPGFSFYRTTPAEIRRLTEQFRQESLFRRGDL